MQPVCRTIRWSLVVLGLLGGVGGAEGQARGPMEYILRSGGPEPDLDLRTVQGGFRLFASGDAAAAGLRMTGSHGSSFSNYGPCSNVLWSCQSGERMVRAYDGVNIAMWFYNSWIVGSPPVNWRRIRDARPSIANALGGGYMADFNDELLGGPVIFGPADLTLGRLFSGVTSTSDGSCRDNTGMPNGFLPAGIPLLAQSGCPETWGAEGWQGGATSSAGQWAAWRDESGSAAFRFDFWRVPEALRRRGYISDNQHVYGETTDYHEGIRLRYGSVLPGGTGAPELQGYPLGLSIRFDVFSFDLPSVNAAKFVRALVINRSEDVWGTGVDYDSLYFGISVGDLGSASSGTAWYNLPARNAVVRVRAGANNSGPVVPCNQGFREPVFGCGTTNGWLSGSQTIVFLKSPIGDERNKLFTRRVDGTPCTAGADPFCDPGHPLRGDTFTINQTRMCGYGQCNTYVWSAGARSGFGFLSGTEENTLAGRDVGAASASQAWSTFRSPAWPNRALYSKYQPDPTWDYNKDGVPDTLGFTSCHTQGCAALASDTQPGGFVNLSSNIGGLHAAGPFSLAARDTVAFFYAVIGGRDSVHTMSQVDAVLDQYLTFFIQPEPPAPVEVLETATVAATDAAGSRRPEVRLTLSDGPEAWIDPYLLKLADDFESASPGTELAQIVAINPGVVDSLRRRAVDNLELVEVYKSCDGGATFTVTPDCRPALAIDAQQQPIGHGWQAWRTFVNEGAGSVPAELTDTTVMSGREYTYVVVAKSRGLAMSLASPGGGTRFWEFAPSLRNPLAARATDPNAVSVYVPASRPAGYRAASVSFTTRPSTVTVPFAITPDAEAPSGSYVATFGNRFLVRRDSMPGDSVDAVTLEVQHHVLADLGLMQDDVSLLTRTLVVPLAAADAALDGLEGGVPDTVFLPDGRVRITFTHESLGFVVASGTTALFATTRLDGDGATPSTVLRMANGPPFRIHADQSVAGDFAAAEERHVRGPASMARLRLAAADSVTPRDVVNAFMVQWQEGALSAPTPHAGGRYEVTWTADPWGRPEGFSLNRGNPLATGAEVAAALASRPVGSLPLTDAATALRIGIPQMDLVPVRLPFSIRNLTYDRPVRVAMPRRVRDAVTFGSGRDTATIPVPQDEWIPGDFLVFIEEVERDSTTAFGVVLDNGAPLRVTHPEVTFSSAVLGCATAVRLSCNPLRQGTTGASGYGGMAAGDRTYFEYHTGFQPGIEYAWDIIAPTTAADVGTVTDSALSLIRVVPNPFVIFSAFQTDVTASRVLFTNLPPSGRIRVYTVAGQYVHEFSWTPEDLDGAGDLFFNLNTRAGTPMATGLYLWVLETRGNQGNPASPPRRAAGKFVIIRGAFQ